VAQKLHLVDDDVVVRSIEPSNVPVLWKLIYGEPEPEWKKWDAPYFPLERMDLLEFQQQMEKRKTSGGTCWS
jgi:hypothetical protein